MQPLLALLQQAHAALLSTSASTIPYAIIAGGIASLTAPRLVGMLRGARDAERMRDERDQLFAISADLLCILDVTGQLRRVNATTLRTFGPEVERPGAFMDLVHPDDRAVTQSALARLAAGDRFVAFENRCRSADGKWRWLSWTAAPARSRQMFLAGRDVTDQKRLEEERGESEARFRSAFDNAGIGMALVAPDGRWLRVNPALCTITGYEEAELLGGSFQEITHPDDLEHDLSHVRRALSGELQRYQIEKRYFHKAGHVVWVLLTVSVVRDSMGKPQYFLSQVQDISERKRVQAALLASEERHRLAALATNDVIWDWDVVNDRCVMSDVLWSTFGHRPDGKESGTVWFVDLVHPEDRVRVRRALAHAMASGDVAWTDEYRFRRADDSYGVVVNRGIIVRDREGRAVRAVGSMSDVTEQRRLAAELRQAQKMEAVGRLAGGIAHDFNNVLTVIKLNIELLLQSIEPADDLHAEVREIAQATERATMLTSQLLAFGRKQIQRPKPLHLDRVVAEMAPMLRRLVREDVKLDVAASDGVDTVVADEGQIGQILMNLVVNAVQAMPNGGHLTIETSNASLTGAYLDERSVDGEPGRYVMLAVSDTGMGMSPDVQARIFEPFFTTKPVGEGTGLGLSTVYGIVKQSRGFIWVYSEVGSGTTFKVYLPSVGASAAPDSTNDGDRAPTYSTGVVLLAEDDETLRFVTRRILRREGYTVLEARTGVEALRVADSYADPIDVLLTDLVMPEMGGRELAEHIARKRSGIRVLFMSGYTDDVAFRRGLVDPAAAFVQKPFSHQALVERLREVLAVNR
ncbi:MAG TPA: PAS domain S-box protein [Gemmatimonadaceae bacterium]